MFTRHDEAIWDKEARAPCRHIHPNSNPIYTKGTQLFQIKLLQQKMEKKKKEKEKKEDSMMVKA